MKRVMLKRRPRAVCEPYHRYTPGRLYPREAIHHCYTPGRLYPGWHIHCYTPGRLYPGWYIPTYTPGRLYPGRYTYIYTREAIPRGDTYIYTREAIPRGEGVPQGGTMVGMVVEGVPQGGTMVGIPLGERDTTRRVLSAFFGRRRHNEARLRVILWEE